MMSIFEGLLLGLQSALSPSILMYTFIGVFLGTLVGALPGVGALTTISLLLPITYHLPATAAIVMLAGIEPLTHGWIAGKCSQAIALSTRSSKKV